MSISSINTQLTTLSLNCKQDESTITQGKAVVTQVFELLKRHSGYSIDRSFIFGSAGKKTAIASSDFDCVVFINNLDMSKDGQKTVLEKFQSLLSGISNVQNLREMQNPDGLKFTINSFDVDLLVAPNLVSPYSSRSDTVAEQATAVYRQLNSSNCASLSPALSESAVRFMKEQTPFVHELVVLCKFWNTKVNVSGYVGGRSTLIELIAVHAGRDIERNYSNNKMYYGLGKFFSLLVDFSSLKIRFDFDATKGQFRMQLVQFPAPFVVEPWTPVRNLAQLSYQQQQAFQTKAIQSLSQLQQAGYGDASMNSIFS